ncbi:hypothetical protein AMAG_17959 [Allomyces macrogynus ATCC 38327]|uniref:Uncharacterized protein n=1 Tax=Allomyces macrogynus (strain ATCC 38327) TaxID=578462 RepID=A0A0L0S2V7_ALLM3|nr:hypothetical protein AMAG_17959 [Allomyces macrogynus ATCC 38327]|eukprot:KNE56740.1 hypothetical protein AMAG_17959 [Allomyces macrogynus ATCC 38327]
MVPKPPPTDFLTADASYSIHKIIYFLDCCRHIGIPEDRTFPLTDLMMDDGDPRAIILTLQTLEAAARKKGWNGPYLPSPPQGYFVGEFAAPRVVPRTVEVVRPEIQRFTYAPQQPVASVAGSIYSAVAAPASNGVSPVPSPAPPAAGSARDFFSLGAWGGVCSSVPMLPMCQVLTRRGDKACPLRGVNLGQVTILDIADVCLCLVVLILTGFLAYRTHSKYAAVGRSEMGIFNLFFFFTIAFQIISVGGWINSEPQDLRDFLLWAAIIHCGLVAATSWILFLNGLVGALP